MHKSNHKITYTQIDAATSLLTIAYSSIGFMHE
ncbi:hypothetical protein DK880_00377 [Candidatus Cardinium hertigii]|uniref:Uncharacterized protein n=1 Tax=Candidatus Cardinium hertigii TaxID=247481 RepID=A0A2Z3LGS3_9BACT|nr:hypothetical protein DK880_00377 [Candidatus Cardinium hertigii]